MGPIPIPMMHFGLVLAREVQSTMVTATLLGCCCRQRSGSSRSISGWRGRRISTCCPPRCSSAGPLVGVFLGLAVYHKFFTRPEMNTDRELQAELQAATILDDDAPERTDWPQWRGVRRDGVGFEPHLFTQWSADGPAERQVPAGGPHRGGEEGLEHFRGQESGVRGQ